MGAGHGLGERLHVHGTSPLHRLAPECKLAATLLFVFAVVSTPREALWAFGAHTAVVLAVAAVAGIAPHTLARRLVIEAPFVAFAVLLPIVGRGERIEVLGLSLSVAGLWAAWNILAKATLGVAASVILASTTPVADLLRGMERLRVPRVFVGICGFMVRYADVITGEMRRMKVARESRGHDPRWIWQARAVAASAGALFIRSYERGERVYLAMVSRGYDGAMPRLEERLTGRGEWLSVLVVPAIAVTISLTAWALR